MPRYPTWCCGRTNILEFHQNESFRNRPVRWRPFDGVDWSPPCAFGWFEGQYGETSWKSCLYFSKKWVLVKNLIFAEWPQLSEWGKYQKRDFQCKLCKCGYSNKASKVGEGVCRLGRWRRISSAFSSLADMGVDQYGAVGHGDVVYDCQASQRIVVPPWVKSARLMSMQYHIESHSTRQ